MEIREQVRSALLRSDVTGPEVPSALRALGPEAGGALVEIIDDAALYAVDAPGAGWAPIAATRRAAELGHTPAIAPMLRQLAACDAGDIAYGELVHGLAKFGAALVEPALATLDETRDVGAVAAICDALSRTGVRDDRVFDALVARLEDMPDFMAANLAEYGDPRALPHLAQAFDRAPLDTSGNLFANQVLIELEDAITELGGELTDAQRAKFTLAMASRKAFGESFDAALRGFAKAGATANRRKRARRKSRKKR